jgi:hypothetical protein
MASPVFLPRSSANWLAAVALQRAFISRQEKWSDNH